MHCDEASGIYFELHGQGAHLFLGFPLMASHGNIFGDAGRAALAGFLDRLTDRYRVLICDYPSIGRSRSIDPAELTAERVCRDLLAVADAAGFERFVWWGYSWGGQVGLQLASRSDRLTALVIGGWTPLGGPYPEILHASEISAAAPPASAMVVLREPAQYAQWVTYNRSVQDWPEARAVAGIRCPRMVYAGANDDAESSGVSIPYASRLRQRQCELEALGWRVEILAGHGHEVGLDPEIIVPVVRDFLDFAVPPA